LATTLLKSKKVDLSLICSNLGAWARGAAKGT
jgi:hypothetical protein